VNIDEAIKKTVELIESVNESIMGDCYNKVDQVDQFNRLAEHHIKLEKIRAGILITKKSEITKIK
jgi:hypothetical protein